MKGKIGRFLTFAAAAVLVATVGQAWLGNGTRDADARGLNGRLSDAIFAKQIAGTTFGASTFTIGVDADGNPVNTTRGFSGINFENGSAILDDSGAFETDEFFNGILAPFGITLADLGIDITGPMTVGLGSWERLGPRKSGYAAVKYKYSSDGRAIFVFMNRGINTWTEDFEPETLQFQIAYYNLVDLFNPFTGAVQPGLTPEEATSIMDPDPANRPAPWFSYTAPEPVPALGALPIPIDAELTP